MKKTISILLLFVLFMQFTVVFSENETGEEIGDEIGDEIDPEEEIIIIPDDYMYYTGNIVLYNDETAKPDISEVILVIDNKEHNVPVDESGYFELCILSSSIAQLKIAGTQYILCENISDNNLVFPAYVQGDKRKLYIEKLYPLVGKTMNSAATTTISDVSVTCFKRNADTKIWEEWMIPQSILYSDQNGEFTFFVPKGEYRINAQKDGYLDYDSFTDENYKINDTSRIMTESEEGMNPIIKLSSEGSLTVVDLSPNKYSAIDISSIFTVKFDEELNSQQHSDVISITNNITKSDVACNYSISGDAIKIQPKSNLEYDSSYTLKISGAVSATNAEMKDTYTAIFSTKKNIVLEDMNGHWAKEYVDYLIEKEIVNGYEENGKLYFKPEDTINRQELAKLIVLALGMKLDDQKVSQFQDAIDIETWAIPYVSACYSNSLIKGNEQSDGLYFAPISSVTRAEIITIIGRSIGITPGEPSFMDWSLVPDWAQAYAVTCVNSGIISGYEESDGIYIRPLNAITRAEAATIITNLIKAKDDQ